MEMLRAEQRKQAQSERRRTLLIWGAVAAVVVVVVGALIWSTVAWNSSRPNLSAVQTYEVTANHVNTQVQYEQTPPVGGDHNPTWLNCGVYTQPVPNEYAVHALEHGAVWVTYQPDLPASEVEKLRDALPSTYTVLSPYPGIDAPAIISAWGHQLKLENADDPRLQEFINEYRLGPQTPEPGAACTGGLDAPGKVA
jgi:hypothetical protein